MPTIDDPPANRDHLEIADEIHVREHLDDQIDAAAAVLRDDLFLIVGRRMIEHLMRALLAGELPAPLGAGGAEHAQAGGARHLHGADADRAARAVDQHRLARHGAPFVEQRAPRGDEGHADTRAFGE